MKKSVKFGLIGAAVAASLIPFELKREENGDFTYKSLLLGVTKTKDEENAPEITVTFFNLPKLPCCKCKSAAADEDVVILEADEADVAAVEACNEAAEAPCCEPEQAAEAAEAEPEN